MVVLTHEHADYLGDAIEIIDKTGAHLIGSPEIGFYSDKHGISYDEGSSPLNIGGYATSEL